MIGRTIYSLISITKNFSLFSISHFLLGIKNSEPGRLIWILFILFIKLFKSKLLGWILAILLIDINSWFIRYSGTPQGWTSNGYSWTFFFISSDSMVGTEMILDTGEGVEIILAVGKRIDVSSFKVFSVNFR